MKTKIIFLVLLISFFYQEANSQGSTTTTDEKKGWIKKWKEGKDGRIEKRKARKKNKNDLEMAKVEEAEKEAEEDNNYLVALTTNAGISSSNQDNRKESRAGVGALGIKFERNFWYGEIDFVAFSRNDSIQTNNVNEDKRFGTNILIPQNSQGGFNNFFLEIGCRGFKKFKYAVPEPDILSFQRLGFTMNFRSTSTLWNKDSISLPIVLNAWGLYLSYSILNLELENKNFDRVRLMMYVGYTGRNLGGDYALAKNERNREYILNTSKLFFGSWEGMVRLDIGNLFATGNITAFPKNQDIDAFSSTQVVISLGIKADLDIPARSIKASNAKER